MDVLTSVKGIGIPFPYSTIASTIGGEIEVSILLEHSIAFQYHHHRPHRGHVDQFIHIPERPIYCFKIIGPLIYTLFNDLPSVRTKESLPCPDQVRH